MATLKDVATLAGVSTATASLALNNGPVNERTRQTVIKAAAQLSYVPNRIGQMLTTGRSNTIEMVILTMAAFPDIVRRTSLFYYLMEGVLAVADEHGFAVRFAVKSYDASISDYFSQIVGQRTVDGIIVIPQFARDMDFVDRLRRVDFPYVLLRPASFGAEVNHVDMGNEEGGRLVADLLVDTGARTLGIINGPAPHFDAIERERGFTSTVLDRGCALVAKQHGDFTIESGFVAMQRIAERSLPDAVFCANDYMAIGALNYLRSVGVDVPGTLALVGYDNIDVASAIDPPITTVDNHFMKLGQTLAGEVIGLIKEINQTVARRIQPELIVRQSHQLGK